MDFVQGEWPLEDLNESDIVVINDYDNGWWVHAGSPWHDWKHQKNKLFRVKGEVTTLSRKRGGIYQRYEKVYTVAPIDNPDEVKNFWRNQLIKV